VITTRAPTNPRSGERARLRWRAWAGGIVLLLAGTFVLPSLVVETALRGARCFVGARHVARPDDQPSK
jgi:hypothetical protein